LQKNIISHAETRAETETVSPPDRKRFLHLSVLNHKSPILASDFFDLKKDREIRVSPSLTVLLLLFLRPTDPSHVCFSVLEYFRLTCLSR